MTSYRDLTGPMTALNFGQSSLYKRGDLSGDMACMAGSDIPS
jgi:hypothetical protein